MGTSAGGPGGNGGYDRRPESHEVRSVMLAQQLANGLVLGSIYALSALGFTLIFGAARVVNFAYGELLMIGAFFTVALMSFAGIGFFIALPIAMLGVAALSVAMFYAVVRPL